MNYILLLLIILSKDDTIGSNTVGIIFYLRFFSNDNQQSDVYLKLVALLSNSPLANLNVREQGNICGHMYPYQKI